MTKRTLATRLAERNRRELCSLPPDMHIRAELDRLARWVRWLKDGSALPHYWRAMDDVLALIKEAKQ